MRVGVISDTHNPSVGAEPPPAVVSAFDGVDVIIHAVSYPHLKLPTICSV